MTPAVVVAGWGQVSQGKEVEPTGLVDPMGLMAEASRRAACSTGRPDLLEAVDGVLVVRVLSRHCPSAADRLADAIGASPRLKVVSGIGGSSPQVLISRAAAMIARGELDRVLIAGGETYRRREGRRDCTDSALFQGLVGGHEREDMVGATDLEERHGVSLPVHGFPLFETALWAESGLSLDQHLARVGERWSAFSRVAAAHPQGWATAPRSATEIVTPTAANRMIAFPYTKFMNPQIYVDLGAAVILERWDGTRGSGGGRPVFFLGGAEAEHRQHYLVERTSFIDSPPLEIAASRALDRAGLELDAIECFDLYSCFPCAVTVGMRALGLSPDDERPMTVTGGLGFFGGPGNNYGLHAVATMAQTIAEGQRETGMTTGLSWFMSKQAVGIYGASPPKGDVGRGHDDRPTVVGDAPISVDEHPAGPGAIDTYTVLYARDGSPERAVIYGTTARGDRFVAGTEATEEVFEALTTSCQVGRAVRLAPGVENRAELL